jgi:hypothetical protein
MVSKAIPDVDRATSATMLLRSPSILRVILLSPFRHPARTRQHRNVHR